MTKQKQRCIRVILLACMASAVPNMTFAERITLPIPATIAEQLSRGAVQDLIVLFDDSDIEAEAAALRQGAQIVHDNDSILAFRRARYRSIKQNAVAKTPTRDMEELRDFEQLPMSFFRIKSRAALDRLLADPRVLAVYEDRPIYPHLSYSLPFIGQPTISNAGITGSGQTVAIIDTGIDYTLSSFGSCTAPGVPSGCRVAASVDVTGNGVTLNQTANNHGTNVAGIVAGVAPGSRIAAINAFSSGSSTTTWVLSGINWAIANKSTYNIGALNMSLGDSSNNSSPCANKTTNPFLTPINNLRTAGIIPVASSGNNGFTAGISNPACTPGAISVGAVYDASWGGPYSWGGTPPTCTDTTASAADRIPCFSNSATFLTMLAPGAFITAAGIQMAGTSQAAPHVAGALAVMRAAYPGDTLDQSVARLTANGASITDSRNGITKPRLNLLAAIDSPANDLFSQRTLLSGDTGRVTAHNLKATKESGEPSHAGNSGGKSAWWSWIPSISGTASIDTHGSSFDTLLAVYSGTTLPDLSQIAANDNDGSSNNASSVSFPVQAGNEYLIAVDGFSGASGKIVLNWSLVQQADLGISMSQIPASPVAGNDMTYTLTVTNHGPSPATGVMAIDQLPTGVTFVSASTGCSQSGETVTCNLGALALDATAIIQVVVNPPSAGVLTSSAQVSSAVSDPNSANNNASVIVTATDPAISVPALSGWSVLFAAACLSGILGSLSNRRRTGNRSEVTKRFS
ncbi:MAG: S8 family serine peptidase [Desulfuromonadales bacterium]|nr:S8 family serine peptidase [Desulfuromonadales bacterium]